MGQFIQRLISTDGTLFGFETDRPGMQYLKERKLDFITPADRAEFLQKT